MGGTISAISSGFGGGTGSYFRLDQHQDQLVFGTDSDLVKMFFFYHNDFKVKVSKLEKMPE